MPGIRKKRVFDSVFGAPSISQPTPVATPATGFTAPGEAFGVLPGSHHGHQQDSSDPVRDQIRWDRSWHEVTHFLNIPNNPEHSKPRPAFRESLKDVLHPETRIPYASHTEDIIAWHTNQVRLHFLHQTLPVLRTFDDLSGETLLFKHVKVLETSHKLYLHGFGLLVEELEESKPDGSSTAAAVVYKFRRDLHAIISHSISDNLAVSIKAILKRYVSAILGLPSNQLDGHFLPLPESSDTEKALRECLGLIKALKNVGLVGERFQIAFAEVMNDAMSECVYLGLRGVWTPQDWEDLGEKSIQPRAGRYNSTSRCVMELCEWISDRYAKLAIQAIDVIDDAKANPVKITLAQVEKWKEMAIGHLASLRTNELFDIVEKWPQCGGALDDLRTAITTPQRRLHLTDIFASTLNQKLLHPGTSTLQILQTYISMIRSFHDLDHSKVLLDRVAFPLQLYLCSREDTVRIIITGLLADTEDSEGNPIRPGGDKLVELALSLNNGQEQFGQRANDEELDWHDMDWMPDPVDAGPGYKRSKSADIIGTLIGVLGSQEVFIKEFQNIIGESLLKQDGGFEKEV
jgi:anaphase-promoting complex subunit 2